jgi:thymidylate synthase (FAD)
LGGVGRLRQRACRDLPRRAGSRTNSARFALIPGPIAFMPLSSDQQAEIARQRADAASTRRPVAPALEEVLYQAIPLLDHGFVRVIDYMGDDAAVVQAARVSYGKGTKKVSEDRGLIHYLMRHRHSTPFEMCEIKFHVKLPIFVARQWIRHRTANVNEYSARYSILDREFYLPAPEQLAAQSAANRQGRGEVLTGAEAARVLEILKSDSATAYDHYVEMLNEAETGEAIAAGKQGLARELARMNLSLNYYTQWYWKIDLYNFMHFLSLRADPHAQYEIRVYAEAMLDVLRKWVPLTAEAFEQHRLHAVTLSKAAMSAVRRMLNGETVTAESSGLGKREWSELQAVLKGDA